MTPRHTQRHFKQTTFMRHKQHQLICDYIRREQKERGDKEKKIKLIALEFQENCFLFAARMTNRRNAAMNSSPDDLTSAGDTSDLTLSVCAFFRLSWPYGIQPDKKTTTDCGH